MARGAPLVTCRARPAFRFRQPKDVVVETRERCDAGWLAAWLGELTRVHVRARAAHARGATVAQLKLIDSPPPVASGQSTAHRKREPGVRGAMRAAAGGAHGSRIRLQAYSCVSLTGIGIMQDLRHRTRAAIAMAPML